VKLNYRPEIDGLRAIAVVSVILYHAQIILFGKDFFKGGFIGVDIFFVISGYLISSLILKELEATGKFSFFHFYERRARRILPALFIVILVSLPFAWIYLLPINFVDFSKSIFYSLGFSTNFYFHYSGLVYGSEDSLLKPFLHTWSLSVEEQFYILFPIILLITYKYFKKYLLIIMITGLFISLFLADWGSRNYPSATLYFLHSRMWELLAGFILAYLEIQRGGRSSNQLLNQMLPYLGLILIGHFIFFNDDKIFYPSFYTLSPIFGVCLIIWFSDKGNLISKILSSKLFVGIGLISYSLYLWHYPVFAFARITEFFQDDIIKKIILGILITILSVSTYLIIEKPFRNRNIISIKFLSLFFSTSLILMIFFNYLSITNDGFSGTLPEILLKNHEIDTYRKILQNNKPCHNRENDFCIFNKSGKKNIVLLGDSTMDALLGSIINHPLYKNYKITHMSYSGNIYIPDFDMINKKTGKIWFKNHTINRKKQLEEKSESIVIIAGLLPLYLSNRHLVNKGGDNYKSVEYKFYFKDKKGARTLKEGVSDAIKQLLKKHIVISIYPIPEVGLNVARKIYLQWINRFFNKKDELLAFQITTSYEIYKERTKESFELLDSIKHPNFYRVYPHTLFCDNQIKGRCLANDNKNIFYVDDFHPSARGAEMINDLILKEIKKIEVARSK